MDAAGGGDGEGVEEVEEGVGLGLGVRVALVVVALVVALVGQGREGADVAEHLLHEVVHVLRLGVEGLRAVGVARGEEGAGSGPAAARGGHGEAVARAGDVAGVGAWAGLLRPVAAAVWRAGW